MNRLLSEIGRSQRLSIVLELKRSEGLPVKEIGRRLGMSYMGVKQHCILLEREGYLDTWRNPKPVGRPELLYRLTRKARELFPNESNALALHVLDGARQLYGPTAPGKLLFLYFREKTEGYLGRLRGDTPDEKAKWLARLRDREGCMASLQKEGEHCIVERHTPIADLFTAYPEAENMEREMFERLLGVRVVRRAKTTGGLYECVFQFG